MFDYQLRYQIEGQCLEYYLTRGWFRRDEYVFTTDEEHFDDGFRKVHWIRYDLEKINLTREARKILKLNSKFSCRKTGPGVTAEREELFTAYKTIVDYYDGMSLEDALRGDYLFASATIEVHFNKQLIGAAHFDFGNECVAGIRNYYHPDYKHLSLGKYLLLQQILWALHTGKRYFYPGYIVDGYPNMNYKLFACKKSVEYYDSQLDEWQPLNTSAFRRKSEL